MNTLYKTEYNMENENLSNRPTQIFVLNLSFIETPHLCYNLQITVFTNKRHIVMNASWWAM